MPLKQAALKLARIVGCLGSPEPAEEDAPTAGHPGPEPGEAEVTEPGRPHRDYVENEARKYWQEITNQGNLVKPTKPDLYATEVWALRYDARDSAIARNNYALAEVEAMQPGPEPDTPRLIEPERPYQAFVESEARKYWQETGRGGTLVKPAQDEIRAAALPILCLALRNRAGNTRYKAVGDVVQHAKEKGWIKRFKADAYESPSYIDALIQFADDSNRLTREIPLPEHPPICYTIQILDGRPVPVPRYDAVIRGNYLYNKEGRRVTYERLIKRLLTLPFRERAVNRLHLDNVSPIYYGLTFERAKLPIYRRKVCVWFGWREGTGTTATYHVSQLRDFPYPSDLVFSSPPKVLRK